MEEISVRGERLRNCYESWAAIGGLIVFSAWLFIGLPLLYWPEVIRQYEPYPSYVGQQATSTPNGSAQAPFFIQILPGPDAAEKANRENEDRLEKQSADRWLVRWTMALFIATLLLFLVTGGLVFFSYREIRLMRDEFNSTHRPKIRVKHLWLVSDLFQPQPITINLTCVNTGTANAILGQIGVRCHVVGDARLLPADPGIDTTLYLQGSLLSGLNWPLHNLNTGRILTQHELGDIQAGHAKLFCVGWLSYLDSGNRLRITGFCRVLKPPAGAVLTTANARFSVCKHPDYEYED